MPRTYKSIADMIRFEVDHNIPPEWEIRDMIRRMVIADIKQRIKHGVKTELDAYFQPEYEYDSVDLPK